MEPDKPERFRRAKCKTEHKVSLHGRWVPGWEGQYSVTDQGVVWTFKSPLAWTLKTTVGKDGLCRVGFHERDKTTRPTVHTLVMALWGTPSPSPSHYILHKDGNKANNKASNLTWHTGPKPNSGLREGEFINTNIYSKATAQRIFDLLIAGKHTQAQIAEMCGVKPSTVCSIARGTHWKCIDRKGYTMETLPRSKKKTRSAANPWK